jgi:hypothetical protein
MKTMPFHQQRSRRSQSGSAVLILLAFLTLRVIFCAATTRAVLTTRQELRLIEKHEVARLATAATNSTPAAAKSPGSQ